MNGFPAVSWVGKRMSRRQKFVWLMSCRREEKWQFRNTAAHQTEDRPEWDRSAEWGKIRLFRKLIKRNN